MSLLWCNRFVDLQTAFMERTKIGTALSNIDLTHKNKMNRLLNETYQRIAFHKEWDWRLKTRFLKTTAKSTTGTVSVTAGSRIVTFSSTVTVDNTMIGKFFRINGDNEWYEIVSTHDDANKKAMLSSPYAGTTDTAASYTLYKFRYGLWPDCAEIVHIVPMTGTVFNDSNLVEHKTPTEFIKLMGASPFQESTRPWHYTVMGKENYEGVDMGSEFIMGYDFMENDDFTRTNESLWLYPLIVNSTTLQITYGRQVENMTADADQPLIPPEKRHIILYGALAEWHLSETHNKGLADRYQQKYEGLLANMTADFKRTEDKTGISPVTRRRSVQRGYLRRAYSCPSD